MLEADLRRILVEFNDTTSDYPADRCVHELFEAETARTPHATAVVFGDREITYADLNAKANQLAHYLRTLEVKPDVLVAVYAERSIDMIIGLLGILKAGGAYLPLDLSYPASLLEFMLEDAEAPVLLTQEHLTGHLPRTDAQVICIDRAQQGLVKFSQENPHSSVISDNLAYVIYTSGSTGRPKGVSVCHRAIIRLVCNTNYITISASDRIAQSSNASFDAATFEIWGALLHGAQLIGIPKELLLSPQRLKTHLREHQIQVLFLTTALFNRLACETPTIFHTLRDVLFGGEAVDPKWVAHILEHGPPQRLLHVYGPTENTTFSTWYPVKGIPEGATTVPIGYPIANTQVYILDHQQRPVPIGAPGELYIGGDGLARGYLNHPELTAEKFIHKAFGDNPVSRLYRTGDWARYLPDGAIEFIGRMDNQIKLRGFRVELGEIEMILEQHPGVRHAIVALQAGNDDQRVVACVVAHDDPSEGFVGLWRQLYEKTYSQTFARHDVTFNTVGWHSSYTGLPIPEAEMREWLDRTVDRLMALKPRKVLEIGCGTGMLVARVAPHCESYVGTDFSRSALDHVRKMQQVVDDLDHITLLERMADDFTGFAPESFDTIIINSVLQHFPNTDYLLRVLAGMIRLVQKGGRIFIGDVSNLALLETFHTSVRLFQAADRVSCGQLRQEIQHRMAQERDLWVAPSFFRALQHDFPEVTQVQVMPKHGRYHNQLTRFRYDALLQLNSSVEPLNDIEWITWHAPLTLDAIRRRLLEAPAKALGIRDIPNARLNDQVLAMQCLREAAPDETAGQLRAALARRPRPGIEPDAILGLRDELPYHVEISWLAATAEGSYDVVFTPKTWPFRPAIFREETDLGPCADYVGNPAQIRSDRQLIPELRRFLQERLPDYMVPASFVLLDKFPLTPNGKVDRRALARLPVDRCQLPDRTFVAPRTPEEKTVAGIWAEVLGLERIGLQDDFFALGGNSLTGMALVNRLQQRCNRRISLADLFTAPTVAGLIAFFDASAPIDPVFPDGGRERGEI
ncbi:MAG: amino acid adenylation domain-containing protein [Methylococcales bacterium]